MNYKLSTAPIHSNYFPVHGDLVGMYEHPTKTFKLYTKTVPNTHVVQMRGVEYKNENGHSIIRPEKTRESVNTAFFDKAMSWATQAFPTEAKSTYTEVK